MAKKRSRILGETGTKKKKKITKTKDLYMPKPRVDREGNLVEMEMNKIGQNAMPWWRKEMIKQDKAREARAELPNKIDAAVDMADFLGLDREALQSMVKQWAGE